MKATIEQMEFCVERMKQAQIAHPKAKIYYDWEESEIRITYPIPRDMYQAEPTNFKPLEQ